MGPLHQLVVLRANTATWTVDEWHSDQRGRLWRLQCVTVYQKLRELSHDQLCQWRGERTRANDFDSSDYRIRADFHSL